MSKIFKEVVRLLEFQKDLKKLSKKFSTLEDDLQNFINMQLNLYHKHKIDNRGNFLIPSLKIDHPKFYKAKKFACLSLKGKGVKSGIRVIYAYFESDDRIELIEIYHKGDKENEDRDRIIKNYSKE